MDTVLMYDSTTAADIPEDAPVVAGYKDGAYAWSEEDWARFPNAKKVAIAVFASDDEGDLLDVEKGDASPSDAPGWISKRRSAGCDWAGIYCDLNTWPLVQAAMASEGITGVPYIVAHWQETPGSLGDPPPVPEGAVGTQFANPDTSGGHYDLSLVSVEWIRSINVVTPTPEPAPVPTPGPAPVPTPEPNPNPGPTTTEVDVKVPVLSEVNPGPKVVSGAVRNLQLLLISHGFGVGITGQDGRFGPNTAAAVRECENHYGLNQDAGIAGEQVWTVLCND